MKSKNIFQLIKTKDDNNQSIQFAGHTFQRNIFLCIAIVCISILFALLLWIKGREKELIVDGKMERPAYEESSTEVSLDIAIDGEEGERTKQMVLQPVQYDEDKAEKLFDQVYDQLLDEIRGENESLEDVRTDLKLPTSAKNIVQLEWYSSDYNVVDFDGKVNNQNLSDQDSIDITLTVAMKYNNFSSQYEIAVTVLPKVLSLQEKTQKRLDDAIQEAEDQQREDQTIELPDDIEGKKVQYYVHNESPSPIIAFLLGALGIAAVFLDEKQKKERRAKIRNEQLQRDYCELVSKLVLLAGAGMTIRKAWERIVSDYQTGKKLRTETRYVYEEMTETWNQITTGVPEETAYERFGKRCGLRTYVKFGALLEQNIRKGSSELLRLLEQESEQAFEDRKNAARKKGEEAGTKLLMPMMLMLFVVLVIVMVPAMRSFQL